MDTNTYAFVGLSRRNGTLSVRYTNDRNRARVLAKGGHTDIMFLPMPQPERVEDCVCVLLDWVETNGRDDLMGTVQAEAERLGFVFA
jgi:hypothetical protein